MVSTTILTLAGTPRVRAKLLATELVLRSSCGCPPGTVSRQPVPALNLPRPDQTAVASLTTSRLGVKPARRPARQAAKA